MTTESNTTIAPAPNEIERNLVLSTGHVSKETADLLDTNARLNAVCRSSDDPVADIPVMAGPYGWFLYCGEASGALPEESDGTRPPWPEDLVACVRYARAAKADYIHFDQAVPPTANLFSYDW
jgi:hypothetical protein